MRFKRLLALLLAAALALSVLLTGCKGGQTQSLAQVILNLLDGKYQNITVQLDPDLEADLRQAVNEGETDAEIRAALEKLLGSGIGFNIIGDGQKGDSAWNLILYPGKDPDAAARSAYLEWDKIFSSFPASGQYTANLSMIETENGYAILVQATVDKAASRNDDDDDEPEDEPEEPKEPYSVNLNENKTLKSVTVNTDAGFQHVLFGEVNSTSEDEEEETALATARTGGFENVTIELAAGETYTVSETFTTPFKGILQGENKEATITLQNGSKGLFEQIDTNGKVENITFDVQTEIKNTYSYYDSNATKIHSGAVAGLNNGNITNCEVTINDGRSITADGEINYAGGLVGQNNGTITSCTVTGGKIQAESDGDDAYAGGLVGENRGTIDGSSCRVENTSVSATASATASAGGLVGDNVSDTVTGTYSGDGDITATANIVTGTANAGGLVGYNSGSVGGTYSGSGTITARAWKNYENIYRYTASVPNNNTSNPNTDQKFDNDNNTKAYAGTGIGYNNNSMPQGPVAHDDPSLQSSTSNP